MTTTLDARGESASPIERVFNGVDEVHLPAHVWAAVFAVRHLDGVPRDDVGIPDDLDPATGTLFIEAFENALGGILRHRGCLHHPIAVCVDRIARLVVVGLGFPPDGTPRQHGCLDAPICVCHGRPAIDDDALVRWELLPDRCVEDVFETVSEERLLVLSGGWFGVIDRPTDIAVWGVVGWFVENDDLPDGAFRRRAGIPVPVRSPADVVEGVVGGCVGVGGRDPWAGALFGAFRRRFAFFDIAGVGFGCAFDGDRVLVLTARLGRVSSLYERVVENFVYRSRCRLVDRRRDRLLAENPCRAVDLERIRPIIVRLRVVDDSFCNLRPVDSRGCDHRINWRG